MNESDWMHEVMIYLSERGFKVFRTNVGKVRLADGRFFDTGLPKGFSDLFAVKDGRAYFFETKVKPYKPTKEQLIFLSVMRRAGCKAGIAYTIEDVKEIINDKI